MALNTDLPTLPHCAGDSRILGPSPAYPHWTSNLPHTDLLWVWSVFRSRHRSLGPSGHRDTGVSRVSACLLYVPLASGYTRQWYSVYIRLWYSTVHWHARAVTCTVMCAHARHHDGVPLEIKAKAKKAITQYNKQLVT